jgi:hypothetical protein
MRIDELRIAGIHGLEVPDDIGVDSEFVISVRLRVSRMEYGTQTMPSSLNVDCVIIDGAAIEIEMLAREQ